MAIRKKTGKQCGVAGYWKNESGDGNKKLGGVGGENCRKIAGKWSAGIVLNEKMDCGGEGFSLREPVQD